MAALHCRPGILAFIVDVHPAFGINGRMVKLADEPAFQLAGVPHWRLEERLPITMTGCGVDIVTGEFLPVGGRYWTNEVPDHNLRPIGKPGDDAVDEMVRLVGAAPPTAAEILQWSAA